MKRVFRAVILVVIGLILTAIQALVFVQYWRWFVIDTFKDMPELSFLQAIAIMTVGSLFWAKDKPNKSAEVVILEGAFKIVIYLIVGWLTYAVFFTGMFL